MRRFRVALLLVIDAGEVEVNIGNLIAAELIGFLESAFGFAEIAIAAISQAEIHEDVGIAGVDFGGVLQPAQGFRRAMQFQLRDAERIHAFRGGVVDFQRMRQDRHRRVELAALDVFGAQQFERHKVIRK